MSPAWTDTNAPFPHLAAPPSTGSWLSLLSTLSTLDPLLLRAWNNYILPYTMAVYIEITWKRRFYILSTWISISDLLIVVARE